MSRSEGRRAVQVEWRLLLIRLTRAGQSVATAVVVTAVAKMSEENMLQKVQRSGCAAEGVWCLVQTTITGNSTGVLKSQTAEDAEQWKLWFTKFSELLGSESVHLVQKVKGYESRQGLDEITSLFDCQRNSYFGRSFIFIHSLKKQTEDQDNTNVHLSSI